ncbi:OmpG porin family protein [Buttiauxella agrestis]
MDEILAPQHRIRAINKKIFVSRKQTLALILSLVTYPAIAEEKTEQAVDYTGSYESYFQDESDTKITSTSLPKKENKQSSLSVVAAGKESEPTASSVPVTLSASTDNKTAEVKKNNNVDNPEDVSLLRLRQEDPPVHWNSIGRNMEVGGLHGNIGTQVEIDDVRWSNNKKDSGKFKLATIQAFLRHDELPNWYFGFWNAREDSYKGQFSNQDYNGTNTINEIFVGHIVETWRGNIGTEVMVGSETATKRWKNRFKVWQDLRLSNKWSLAGYAYGEYQPQGNEPGNGNL